VRLGLALLLAGHVGLLFVFRLAEKPGWTLSLLALAFVGLLLAGSGFSRWARLSPVLVLVVAAVLRLLVLPLPPTLSDDLLRYLWDGKTVAAGFNPYIHAPESEVLHGLRDADWEALPHKDVPTVYPPVAEALFSIAARLPASLYVLKSLLAFVDLVGCALLLAIARRRGLPVERTVWFAWNPLVVLETAGMGHVDALGVTACIAVVLSLGTGGRRLGRAAVAAAVGVMAKLVPLLAFPMWARSSGRPLRFLLLAGGLTVLGAAPVVVLAGGVPPGLVRYAISWEFNGPLYEPLWRALAVVGAPELVSSLLDGLKSLTGWHELWNRFYPYRYPQFLAKLVLGILLAVLVARSVGRRDVVSGTGRLFGWMILCSATVYPWYLLWVLPWAALCRHRAWLALSALMQVCYLPQLLQMPLFPWFFLLVWVPFMALLAWSSRWSTA
jgi:hypothetical protein